MRRTFLDILPQPLSHSAIATGTTGSALSSGRRRQRWALGLQWAVALAGAMVVAPTVYLMLKGLIGLVAAATIGLATIHLAPVFSLKLANLRIRLLRDEVQTHPIDALENEQQQRRAALDLAYEELSEAKAALASFEEDMTLHGKTHPEDIAALERQSEQSRRLVLQLEAGLSQVELDLVAFGQQVARARSSWKLALSQHRLAQAIGHAQGGAQGQWQADTALEATRCASTTALARRCASASGSATQPSPCSSRRDHPRCVAANLRYVTRYCRGMRPS